jgi:hypothetical protein
VVIAARIYVLPVLHADRSAPTGATMAVVDSNVGNCVPRAENHAYGDASITSAPSSARNPATDPDVTDHVADNCDADMAASACAEKNVPGCVVCATE